MPSLVNLRRWFYVLISILLGDLLCHYAAARDVFLTIGGGGNPTSNQVSLEKNVSLMTRFLNEQFGDQAEHHVFFADGDGPLRDVQYVDDAPVPKLSERLASLHGQAGNFRHRYRNHDLSVNHAAATHENLVAWFDSVGTSLTSGDRLFIYVTAHGGKGEKDQLENTRLYLWGQRTVDVREFHTWLTKVDPQVPIVVVMVQCYSGGFSDMIYADAEAKPTPIDRPWCGFYATVPDRVAAGCTPDTKEDDYHEYSTYFFEALRGLDRLDRPMQRPDFNGDGITTLEEAHASVVIRSKTIDIPIRTSDRYLRKLNFQVPEGDTAFDRKTSLETLRTFGNPVQVAIVDSLIETLGIDPANPGQGAEALADRMESEKRDFDRDQRRSRDEARKLAETLKNHVIQTWPELQNPWSPFAQALIVEESDAILSAIEDHASCESFDARRAESKRLAEEAMERDRRYVKCQRLLYALETLALRGNLQRFGALEEQESYDRLLTAESAVLASP